MNKQTEIMTNQQKRMYHIQSRAMAVTLLAKQMGIQKSSVFLKCDKEAFEALATKIYNNTITAFGV